MRELAQTGHHARQSRRRPTTLSKDRKDIYLGDGLTRAIAGMPGTLSTNVNLIADRYMAMIAEAPMVDLSLRDREMLRAVIAESRGHRIEGREIHGFPGVAAATLTRLYGDEAKELCLRLQTASYYQLVALVHKLERQP